MNPGALIRRHSVAVYFGVAYLVPILAFLALVGPRLLNGGAMQATESRCGLP